MRYMTADYIFPITSSHVKNGTVVVDDDGAILEISKSESASGGPESEIYRGIICPGFINSHCHLEHSCLKGIIEERTGLTGFISSIKQLQKEMRMEEILDAIVNANAEMMENGIVAVGDISNRNHSFTIK